MRALIGCEYSATVREAFKSVGFDAWSCDLLPSEIPGNHYQCSILDVLGLGWDIMVAHPPCNDLSVSGARWFKDKLFEQPKAIQFFNTLWEAPIHRICLENPVNIMGQYVGKPTQSIQPWQFGDGEVKRTCLWLKNLPKLIPTCPTSGREARVWKMAPGPDRAKERARFPQGIANAMASQWGLGLLAGTI